MAGSLEGVLSFTKLLQQLRKIERRVLVDGADRNENDVEHSYSVAMLAWYVNATYQLGLNIEKVLQYSLIHDLVEVYAGDVWFYQTDQHTINNKKESEEAAAHRIENEYPEFPELHGIIRAYEAKIDIESRFVYALDKIDPVLHIYLDQGRTWKKENVVLDKLEELKASKVTAHATIESIFKELVVRLRHEQSQLFNSI